MDSGRNTQRYPRVPIQRRLYAFAVDFLAVWFVSAMAADPFLQFVIFIAAWIALRVFVVGRYRGQSLGRWLFDLLVIDPRWRRVPELLSLTKREAPLAVAAYMAAAGAQFGLPNPLSFVILLSPLLADLIVAIADINQLALHDRFGETLIVPTKRGFSLDVRMRKWVALLSDRVQK